MRERRLELLMLFLVGLLLLVSTVATPSLVYASPPGEYDYVDNNMSNVDASPDKGTHSNFTAQQYGPDPIYDTLTEENTGSANGGGTEATIELTLYDATDEYVPGPKIVFINDTHGYIFYQKTDGGRSEICYSKTTNGGTSWTYIGAIDSATRYTFRAFSVWYDKWTVGDIGTKIHIAANCYDDDIVHYNYLDTSDDSTRGTWANAFGSGSCNAPDTATTIAKSSDGYLFFTSGGTNGFIVGKSTNGGDYWTDITPSYAFFDDDDDQAQILPLSSGDMLVIYEDITADALYSFVYDEATDTWDASATTLTTIATHATYYAPWGAVFDKSTNDTYLAVNTASATAGGDLKTYKFSDSSRSWSTLTDIYADIGAEGGTVKMAIDQNNQDLYAIYVRGTIGTNAHIYYKKSTDGGSSWESENQVSATLDDNRHVTTNFMSDERIYAGWFDDDNNDLFGNTVADISPNYELDLEVQWTNATYDLPNAELCIFGGTMGSENIRVDVWNGSTWHNIFTDLSSEWNNVSVTNYLVSPTFTIRFKGETETGDTSQDSWEIDATLLHIWGAPPIANFSYTPEYPYTDETVTFNASDSYDPDGLIANYLWDFGDGTNGTEEVTTHTYADDGTYTVVLTVTDNDDLSDITSTDITVLNRPPIAIFTESAETVYTEEAITFNASDGYDPDGTIVSYFWDFGDGTNATGVIVNHSYADDGAYNVTLTVTDDDGATASTSSTKTILNRPPVASFTESAETVLTGEVITFNASGSYDPDGIIVSYFWDFGDGANATGIIVEHSYADDGSYTVTLTVTDDDGATDTATAIKTVLNRPPVASFTESATTVLTGEVIYFNASDSYDPDGTIVSYFWDFGDGTNATGVIVEHAYADDGAYTVTLTVTDNDGGTDTTTSTKTVLNRPPVASFTESAETVLTGEPIYFNASASSDSDGTIVSYFWDFGDGTNATGIVVSHAYVDDYNYTVTLRVTDNDDATDTISATKTVLNRPPIAIFTESTETAYVGETVTFNASDSYDSDGTIVTYFWDFGDGTNATGVIVEHAYSINGTYIVTLTVTDDDDTIDSTSSTQTILWNEPPVAIFTESAEMVYTGEVIYFNASNSYDSDGYIANYFWDFGDGTNTTGVTVNHSYVDNGVYTVTLTVTDDRGATSSTNATKTVLNRPPIASFTESAETVHTGEAITFNATESYDPDGTIVEYFWDFGDGTNGTGVIVEHSYADNGNYTVTLTVTDDDGATDAATSTKTVLNRSPVASFTESTETVYTSEPITFNATDTYDPDGTVVSFIWDFGDGTNATGVIVEHAYADDGNYPVTLTVTDNDGATDTAAATKTVLNRSPVAVFTESAETVYTGETITFNASDSYDPDGSIVEYFWDFGDGTNTTGMIVTRIYADNGVYTVTLTVTDDDSASASATATKTVLNRPPVASFTESAETVYTGEVIYFNASDSYDPDGVIVSYFWDFGDGSNAAGVVVSHAYSDNGDYTVTLIVTDNDGATDSTSTTKTVLNRSPVANFTESAEVVYTGETITFNASSSYDADGIIASYFWDFGDGTNATGMIITHAYADNGTYTVTLIVTDDDEATDTVSAVKTVLNRPPVASFTESTETLYTDEIIVFNSSSSYDPDGAIVSYFWDFGDGTNATGIVVQQSYSEDGIYTVTLTVTDDDGAVSTATATKTVLNRLPVASFTESAETVYTGELITFNASESYDPDGYIVSYFWDFGDGINATGVAVEHAYADDGAYAVTLTVTDDDGATSSTTAIKNILNRLPIASFTESAETVYTNESITFNATSSYDPDGTIISYFWDFGDGTNATSVIVNHSYVDDGIYPVTLTVTDNDGATASTSATKTILNRAPVASFTESAETVYTSETITFNASASYDSDGTIVSFFWDFGDGTNATGVVVTYAYADDGTYMVTLTVTDDDGATDTATSTKTVLNRTPVAVFTESAETVYTGEDITFNASDSYDSDGTIISYFWDFGDGANATGVTVEHAYADDGNYTVTLTVTDDDGAFSSISATKTVLNRPPVAVFTESAETVYTSEVIAFNASDSYDLDGTIVSYFWDFGDGTNATGVTTQHAYVEDANYTVTLTVTDNDGATTSTSTIKTVLNRAPVAIFTESAETVLTGRTITFDASDSYDLDGTIVSYFWDFGDGTTATGITIGHAYADDGNYTVTLTVTDNDEATAIATAVKTVLNRPPVAIFTTSATTALTGQVIYFDASDSYDSDGVIVSYFWDFGDGTNATGITVDHGYADDGTYVVTSTVTDDDGATGVATATIQVLNRAPVAIFTESAETVYTSETVTFNASDSYDPDGYIVSYFWDFGDGSNATGMIVTHAYAEDGNYTVTLTVTDDDGATDTTTATKSVLNRAPVAIFTESAETVLIDEAIYFNASDSYDPDGTIVSYFWGFGDGTNATGVTTEHAYSSSGVYTVTLTVTDNDGATSTVTAIKTVEVTPPVAIFTESAETVLTGEAIYFNASDSYDPDGTIVSFSWDFGDGTNATGITTQHAYADDGNYTVTLTVTDNDSATDAATAIKTVLNRPPIASFTESAETVYTGEVITFNASVSYDLDGDIVSFLWDFGDGANATGVVVEHAYSDDGNYTVTLTVTDDDGASASTTATKTVLNRPPVASFTESAGTVYTGEIITFNASNSYDPDGSIVSFFWDFGDGANATGAIVSHAYADDSVYAVTLTVTDDDGATNTATATKTVLNRPPVATFTESAETVYTNEIITFNASDSYDLDGYIASYFWAFGDGTNATGVIVEHAYADDGPYIVMLTVTDDDSATGTTTSTKTVLNRAPVAIFTESAETALTGEVIYFNASDSYDPDGTIVGYFWDFGDGTNASGVTVNRVYADDGIYTVTLTVTDDDGATDIATSTKTILNRSPVATFTESTTTVPTGTPIYFNASESHDPDGTIVSYFWTFGDGTNATGVTVEHAYADDGNYFVTLTITDDDGATGTASSTKTVLNRPPVAVFTESAEIVYTNEAITFNASASYDPDGYIVSYFWDFGDGTNATGIIVEHSYPENGVYKVTLTVTDDDGATDVATGTKTVLNRYPVASFTESAETVYTDETITFNASDSYDPDGAVVSYFWDFGDGANATGVVVEHAYSDDGIYTVTLTVTDDDSATASATATKTVLNRTPVAIFTESAETVYTGETIAFEASDSYDPDGTIVSFFWDFGDGTNATGVTTERSYSENGTYIVTLTVTDDDGATASASATKFVGNSPPVAIFAESAETVYTGEIIAFNASDSYDSDGTIVSFFWDFGDGANATGAIVSHAYADDGVYAVTLTVTDDDSATGTTSSVKTVLNRPPVASFTESAETVYTNETVTFNASDSYDLDGAIVGYFWDFGDGTNATSIIVNHAYIDDGVYTVILTVVDDDSATASANATKTVLNRPPVAVFTESAETVYTGEIITFNASDSYDLDGIIVSHFWDFGDGKNATGMTVDHAYADDGNYTVTSSVTDDDGATASATATKTVLNRPPVAIFTESAHSVPTGEVIYFNASDSYDLDGIIVSHFWDFGDGKNATGITVEHAYADDGTYIVTLTVTDDDGATASASATKFVGNSPPVAIFAESAETVYTGETIAFEASDSYDPDGTIVSFFWDFGDGTNATGMNVGHAYTDDGNYTVTLTVTDDDSATSTATAIKTILNRLPVAAFSASSTVVSTGQNIYFDASASYDSDGVIVSHFWDFGDGTNATGVTVTNAYADNGTYLVTLTVTDDDGVSSTATVTIKVLNRLPVAVFTESAESALTGEVIYFNASDSYDSDGIIVSYLWDFGDGTNATGVFAEHAYVDDGTYTVTLTITDDDGATAPTTATKTILNRPPVATFTESAETVYTGETIYFDASDSYDPDGIIVSYFWDFGDGTNETGVTVEHAYVDDGVHNVTLTIVDNDGAASTFISSKTILNRLPVAVFTESAESALTGEVIYFNASDSYDSDGIIVSYLWDFGDGTNATGVMVDHNYSDDGIYTVTLTVTDNDGATASITATKAILNRPPICAFTESAETVYIGQPIYFNASSSYDPDGTIVSYFWDFGDGTNATGIVVEHAYATNGTYTVTLTVTDDDGATDSLSSTKTILWNDLPIAIFTESAETVYTDEVIYFNASDSYDPDGTIIDYLWDFGDGTNATGAIVSHSYADNSLYTVTLIVIDDKGAIGTATSTKTVFNRYPVAVFTESTESAFTGETIYFNASDSYDLDGIIVSYFWDFGDGTNATGIIVEHAYADDGNYTVTLTVTDNDSSISSLSSPKTIHNRPPVASFAHSPDFPIAGQIVTFDASASYDPDGVIGNYTWDFGDGNITAGTTPVITHAYAVEGNYPVTLTVTDDDGGISAVASALGIRNYPTATFDYSPAYPGEGQAVTFDASSSTPNGGIIVDYTWDFSDGNITTVTEPVVIHVYGAPGNYTVTLTVTDSEGLSAQRSKIVEVGVPPVASFTYSPTTPFAGDIITFDASASYDPDGVIGNYTWDFGDGNITTVTEPLVTHVYAIGESFIVQLTVIDDKGISEITTDIVSVRDYPTADFTWSPSYPIVGEQVTFDASTSSPNGGVIISYLWNFGDGTQLNITYPVTTHTYTIVGSHNVTLTVKDSEELTDTISKIVKARDYPTADFAWSPLFPVATETITFNASLSKANAGTITGHIWDFGDGPVLTGYLPIITHVYDVSDSYSVTLTVINSEGLSSSITKQVVVSDAPPICSFGFSPEVPIAGQTATFDASDSYDPDGVIVNYTWDFDDGNITTVNDPIIYHTYVTIGNFTVTLLVTDNTLLTTSTTKTLKIITHPAAGFTWSPSKPESSKPVTFDASMSTPNSGVIANYTWDFGDGSVTTVTEATIIHTYSFYGNYTVILTVFNSEGLSDAKSQILTVTALPPTVDFSWQPINPVLDETVTFNASSSVANGGTIVYYEWDFGDGSAIEFRLRVPTITHQYATYGSYTVTLKATDSEGLDDVISKVITVKAHPDADFNWLPQFPQAYEILTFDASVSEANGGAIVSYIWDFGDGNLTLVTYPAIAHRYYVSGDYIVTLNVTDDEGLWDIKSKVLTVAAATEPTADFTWSPLSVHLGETVAFDASPSTPNGGVIISYTWDFDDGNITTLSDPIVHHVYVSEGSYTVTLRVTDSQGLWSTISKIINILPPTGPTATFIWYPSVPKPNQTVTFDASSSTLGWNGTHHPPIISYTWDFDDGNITAATDPTIDHIYATEAYYTVTLTVMDVNGLQDNLTQMVAVLQTALIGDITGPEGVPDGRVDMRDISFAAIRFGAEIGDPNYDPRADITGTTYLVPDGIINMRDISLIATHFGEHL